MPYVLVKGRVSSSVVDHSHLITRLVLAVGLHDAVKGGDDVIDFRVSPVKSEQSTSKAKGMLIPVALRKPASSQPPGPAAAPAWHSLGSYYELGSKVGMEGTASRAETLCMLSLCDHRLLHVLGLSFPLLTRRLLLLCPHCLMKPLVVFILGGPSAGKGTQCAHIIENHVGISKKRKLKGKSGEEWGMLFASEEAEVTISGAVQHCCPPAAQEQIQASTKLHK
ncbi:hypothetical protein GH733_009728 [Mirounga leonina]|nr:hypothetical protein GH733_009728 [Mirounga leonina]